jgi:diguanylate cyclase (GGDEF)-like protein
MVQRNNNVILSRLILHINVSKWATAFCLLFFILSASAATSITFTAEEQEFIKAHPVIVVGAEYDWPPYDFVENGEYTGAGKDYLLALERYTGLTFDIRTGFSWEELLAGMKAKQFDMQPLAFWEKQRTSYMNFTEPYLVIRQYFFVHNDAQGFEVITDLYGKTVAIPKGYAQVNILKEKHPEIHILEVTDSLAAIDAVVTRRADALVENTAMISYLTKQNNIQGLKTAFASDIGIHNVHMTTRKDWPLLRDILQKGLNAITLEEKATIAERWISYGSAGAETSIARKVTLTDEEQQYLQQKKVIKACVERDWMPIEGVQDGQYIGMGADYLAIFQQKINIPIEIVDTKTWAETIDHAKARKCDMIMLSLNSKKRQEYMDISTPYLTLPVVIATKADVSFISDITEIANQRIGMVEGYAFADIINAKGTKIDFVFVPTKADGLQMVAQGKLFGFMDTVASIDYAINRDYQGELKIGGKFGVNWDLGVATRNDEALLAQIMEKVLLQISEQSKQQIFNNWVSFRPEQGFNYDLFWKILVAFSIIIIGVFFRNRQLIRHRREINKKNVELEFINSQLEKQKGEIQHLADHDFLTNLPNRKSFLTVLEHAISVAARQDQVLAILFLDLDRFKNINDSIGHHVGDRLLQLLSVRFKGLLRESDTVARLGGDEFLILLEGIESIEYPSIVAEKILTSIREPIHIADHTLNLSASIGIALFPNDGSTVDTLIKNADSAMYLAKDKGKDHFQYFTKHLSQQIERHLILEQALQDAVDNKQLSLCFQSQLGLKQKKIVGAEALLRWNHPNLGNVSPVEFIPIAEESGLIVEIGEWVFRNACQEFVKWREAGFELESLSINVSSVQFKQKNLPEIFKEIIDQAGIAARQIEIEITERYIMEDSADKLQLLDTLRQFGFKISVDDFGTGYSSMAYLKRLPLDIIKIDKSFISDIPHDNNDVQITKAILALSHSLGYTVIAEGIETEEQFKMLQEMSCDIGQGYYFSKPLPSDEFLALLAEES